jgi:iron complex outermembrane recepter protein
VDRAKNNTAIEGKIPANIPNQQGRIELDYVLPVMECISTMGAVNWVGRRPVDAVNSAFLPAVATFDAGIAVSKKLYDHRTSLQVNITNASNKVYWATYKPKGTVGLGLGEPRLISVSCKVEI